MALPVLAIAAGAGLLALLALSGKKSSSPGSTGEVPAPPLPPTPAPPPTPGAPSMPPALKAQFDDLLSNGVNADGLDTVANEMDKFGFANEAATLRARANQIRQASAVNDAANAAAQAAAKANQPPPFVPGVLDGPAPAPRPAAPASIPIPAIPGLTPAGLNIPIPGGGSIPIPVIPPPPPTAAVQRAKVTTKDSPPSGDLIMRTSPSDSGAQVPGGGAEKDGIVVVINPNASADGVWSEIDWPGGSRRPASRGFAKKKFLVNLPPSPTTSGMVVGAVGTRYAKCVAPSGCRLRVAPSTEATFRAMVASGETVQVLNHAQGQKADHGSPGPGGWAQVKYKHLTGWVPSEWLTAA